MTRIRRQQSPIDDDRFLGAAESIQHAGSIAKNQGIIGIRVEQRLQRVEGVGVILGLVESRERAAEKLFRGNARGGFREAARAPDRQRASKQDWSLEDANYECLASEG